MSASTFQVLEEEIASQVTARRRSDDGGESGTGDKITRTRSLDALRRPRSSSIDHSSRRALYGSLPFVAAFGMQHREHAIRDVLVIAAQKSEDAEVI